MEDMMSMSTDRWARSTIGATAVMFALSLAMEMLGGGDGSVPPKVLLLESLELAFPDRVRGRIDASDPEHADALAHRFDRCHVHALHGHRDLRG
jgi:hypothetical protein